MTEFPDRNLDHLRARVASGLPSRTYLDGETRRVIDDVAELPVGTVLRDDLDADPTKYAVWVRFDDDDIRGVLCVLSTFDGGSNGQQMEARRLANAVVIGAVPGTPAASA